MSTNSDPAESKGSTSVGDQSRCQQVGMACPSLHPGRGGACHTDAPRSLTNPAVTQPAREVPVRGARNQASASPPEAPRHARQRVGGSTHFTGMRLTAVVGCNDYCPFMHEKKLTPRKETFLVYLALERWGTRSVSSVQSLSRVRLFLTPRTAAGQASLSITSSRSLLKLTSIASVMPSNHLVLCRPLLLLPSIFPSIRVFSNESVPCIRWPQYWSFSFSISPYNEYSGLISFRIDWLDLLAVQGILKSLLQYHSAKASYNSLTLPLLGG